MRLGSLVVKRMRWNVNSHFLGVVVGRSTKREDLLLVLWNKDGKYKIQEHLSDALIDLDECSEEVLKARTCISA